LSNNGAASGDSGLKPKISPEIIGNKRYELVKTPEHAETHAWHVLVSGIRATGGDACDELRVRNAQAHFSQLDRP
jgi:hypothetical protein